MTAPPQASAALARLLAAFAARRGIVLDPAPARGGGPRVALAEKRRLLAAIAETSGVPALLEIGRELEAVPFDPMLHLLFAQGPGLPILRRWCAVERHVHSRHRTALLAVGPRTATLRHVSVDREPPLVTEDVLIAGLLAGLLARGGCTGVRLALLDGTREIPLLADGRPLPVPPGTVLAAGAPWRLAWDGEALAAPRRPPLRGPDVRRLGRHAAAVLRMLLDDPLRRWPVEDLARALSLSARSLQRRLAEEGTSLSRLVAEARIAAACDLMTTTDLPLWAVALEAGFTDGPHFTRSFQAAVGLSPSDYRASAGAP
jgi:AraC-like DNA-binding protein